MSNVIREDVIAVGFDIDFKEFKKLKEDVEALKKSFSGDMGGDAFEDLKKQANGASDGMDKARKSARKLGDGLTHLGKKAAITAYNGLKKVAGISFKLLIGGMLGVAAAAGKIAYESIQAYAEFEQLKGGVETLFKDSADIVMKNANNAYKTAGLSANAYMETVTSFSASLLQSLGGDTAKAAQYADMALSDMADNANKMGTDMGSIQYAYQGFAKQNYTMLDNLKLGYGGTKTEMERLVKDAAKIDKSIDANSLSYGNVVKAIHAIQKEMGIYGTTQKEAEHTITGSLNSMKASWGNLLTAMASGENIDQCIENMVSSVEIFGKNVIPVAEKALVGIGTLVEKLAPIIADKLPDLANKLLPPLIKAATTLIKGLVKSLPSILKTVGTTIVDIVGDQFPVLKGFGKLIADNANKVAKFIPVLFGLVAAFKAFKTIKSVTSVFGGFGGGKGKASEDGSGGFIGSLTSTFGKLARTSPATILKGMANLALIIGGFTLITAAFISVAPDLAELSDVKSLIETVAVIAALGLVATELSKLAEIAGKIPITTVLKGLANMAMAIVGMSALFLILGATSMLDFDLKRVLAIAAILGVLGVLGGALVLFAGLAGVIPVPLVLMGLANIALVLAGLTALILAFGALAQINGIHEFIETGGELLASLFNVIGEIAGSLIGGIGEGISNSLPTIGQNLADFATSIKPLLSVFNGMDLKGAGAFFVSMGAFLASIAASNALSFFTGGNDFEGIAEGLNTLSTSEGVKNFFTMVNGLEDSSFNKGKLLFECLDGISNLPNVGGLGQLFTGTNDFEGVANGLGTLASSTGVRDFFKMLSDIGDNAFNSGKLFFECLDGISNLPNVGGFGQLFSGTNDFEGVARGLEKLSGKGVKDFFAMVSNLSNAAFTNANLFFECMDGISNLPNVNGFGQLFSGTNDFEGVANGLTKLSGEGVKNFFAMVQGLEHDTFSKVTSLFETLGNIDVENEGGVFQAIGDFFGGENDLAFVGEQLGAFAKKSKGFFEILQKLDINTMNGLWDSLARAGGLSVENLGKVVDESINHIIDKTAELPNKMSQVIKQSGSVLANSFVEVWIEAVKASVSPVNKLLQGANWVLKQFGSKKSLISWTPYAKGTNGHKGGNALVNDGRGAELVQMPNGNTFIPQGRNVFIPNAPQGMKVLSAEKTALLMGKRTPTFNYADGVGEIDIWSFIDNPKGLVNKISEGISYRTENNLPKYLGEAMVSTISEEMSLWTGKLFEEEGAKSLSSYVASKGVRQWRSTVIRALKMEGQYSLMNVARTLFQMRTESGGNPLAINLWDKNAKAGTPSKGLMQVIDPTFKAYAREGFDKNIYDPLSNILASIRYAVSRYGSLKRAYRGVGYANGGFANTPSIFGEDGLEAAIPLSKDKRRRGIGLWEKTGEMLGVSYTPETTSGDNYANARFEQNTYSPQFTINVTGSNDERSLARKIKRIVQQAIDDVVDEAERSNPKLREV